MNKDWDEKALIADLRRHQRQEEMASRFRPSKATQAKRNACAFERQVTRRLVNSLKQMGFDDISLTTHKAPFDMWLGGLRVEIKASVWNERKSGGRYHCTIRNHQADLVLFVAVNGTDHHFIIPQEAIEQRQTVEITSYDVEVYNGQWKPNLENWDILKQAVEQANDRPHQLTLL